MDLCRDPLNTRSPGEKSDASREFLSACWSDLAIVNRPQAGYARETRA